VTAKGSLYARGGVDDYWIVPIEREARVCDLDDEGDPGRMFIAIVSTRSADDGQIRLGFRVVTEGHGLLVAHDPSRGDEGAQQVVDGVNRRGVITALRLRDDQLAADELHGLVDERAELHQSIVLIPVETMRGQRDLLHAFTLVVEGAAVNVRES
jgi:hypothetical protein